MKTAFIRTLALAVSLACIPSAFASDWVDTRLSFVFADNNLLAGPGETNPNSPPPRFGAGPQNTLFFDNFDTRFSGFETLSHLVLYSEAPSFFEGLSTEAALAVLLFERPSGEITLRDASSYIRIAYRPPGWGEREGLSLVGFPVSADRFRLGYAYRISWGGSGIYGANAQRNGVPGAKLQLTRDRWYAYVGAKTALLYQDILKEETTAYGLLAGAGVDILETLRVEAGGGYFQRGVVPSFATQGIEAPVNAAGGSARVVYHVGMPVGTSVDFRLYKNDPDVFQKIFRPEQYAGGLSYSVELEGSYLVQTLADPDEIATVPQTAQALALQGRLKYDLLRVHLLGLYRTLSFIQFDVPSIPPYFDFPEGSEIQPEMFLALGADYHFPKIHFTPGIIFGVQQAATLTSPEVIVGGDGIANNLGRRTIIVRDVNQFSILPAAQTALPIYSAKTTGKWDISESVAGIYEVYWTRDPNRATFRQDVTGVVIEEFEREDGIGFNLIVQARF